MRSRRTAPTLLFAIAIACASLAPASAAAAIAGFYDSPLGKVRLVEKDGVVRGSMAEKGGACGFPAGKKVLEGTRLDDSITGSLRACRVGEGCKGEVEGVVMLLVTREGKLLSGAVHLDAGKCGSPLDGDGISLRKGAPPKKKAKAPAAGKGKAGKGTKAKAAVPKAAPKDTRRQAEALAVAGQQLFETGAIEEARSRFMQATKVDPSYSQGYVGVGVTYYMRDRYDEALDFYKKGLEADPANRDAYYNVACVYALKGEKEQALRYLRIAVLNGYVDLQTLAEDSDLKSLHGHQDFEALKGGAP